MWWVRKGTCLTGGDSYYLEDNVEVEDKQITILGGVFFFFFSHL